MRPAASLGLLLALLGGSPAAQADWLGERLKAVTRVITSTPQSRTPAKVRPHRVARRGSHRRDATGLNIGNITQAATAVRSNIGQSLTYAASGVEGVENFVASIGAGASKIPKGIGSGVANPAKAGSVALAAAIRNARNLHYANSRPLPDRVIAVLSPTIPMTTLKRARYVKGGLYISLPNLVNDAQKMFAGHDHAVVVDDVIVFSSMPGAATAADIEWWAHEVHHVYQYQVWGVDKFAENYLSNPARVEQRANQVAARAVARFRTTARVQAAKEQSLRNARQHAHR